MSSPSHMGADQNFSTLLTPQPEPSAVKSKSPKSGRWTFTSILVIIIALAGGIVFAYPLSAPWFSNVLQAEQILEYQNRVDALSPERKAELLEAAHYYNQHLPTGPLRDPYVINSSGEAVSIEEGREDYNRQLLPNPEEGSAPMSRIVIPGIDVDLPIYHGTSDDVLSKGVGHFYGSGLPVGGPSVHTVLTAHSGYIDATLFDNVDKMQIGDEFYLNTLGETQYYRVDNIEVVLPDESELLRQVHGQDYVTLITCTPKLVNTHRLLVRGVRIDGPAAEADGGQQMVVRAPDPGFPWWSLIAIGPAVGAFFLVRPRRKKPAHAAPTTTTPNTY